MELSTWELEIFLFTIKTRIIFSEYQNVQQYSQKIVQYLLYSQKWYENYAIIYDGQDQRHLGEQMLLVLYKSE